MTTHYFVLDDDLLQGTSTTVICVVVNVETITVKVIIYYVINNFVPICNITFGFFIKTFVFFLTILLV